VALNSAMWRLDLLADLIQEDVFFYEGNTHLPMEEHAALSRATNPTAS
jgi:hypothetical protein